MIKLRKFPWQPNSRVVRYPDAGVRSLKILPRFALCPIYHVLTTRPFSFCTSPFRGFPATKGARSQNKATQTLEQELFENTFSLPKNPQKVPFFYPLSCKGKKVFWFYPVIELASVNLVIIHAITNQKIKTFFRALFAKSLFILVPQI